MIETEQVLELIRVLLSGLEPVDEVDLAVEEALVAAGQVHEDVRDAPAEQLALLLGDVDGHLLDLRHRGRQLGDLVAALDLDRTQLGRLAPSAAAERLHQRGEVLAASCSALRVSLVSGRLIDRPTRPARMMARRTTDPASTRKLFASSDAAEAAASAAATPPRGGSRSAR